MDNRFSQFSRREALIGVAALGLVGQAMPAGATTSGSNRFSVVVRGSGPDVILIPGLTSGREVWNGTVAAVPGYRYHLIQVGGFAGEPVGGNAQGDVAAPVAEALAGYIKANRLNRPAVIGHSMGGTIGLMLAARHPTLVGKLMVVDMLPAPAGLVGYDAAEAGPLADRLQAQLMTTPQGQQFLAGLIGMFGAQNSGRAQSDTGVVARSMHELAAVDLTSELPRITAPLTVVYATPAAQGAQRQAVETQYRHDYAAAKTAKLVPVPGSGHMIMYDQPARFHADVKAFLG